jgi:hypothetical protein
MVRGVRWYLAGCLILITLAGCGRGFLQFAERDKWRREAEIACLKSDRQGKRRHRPDRADRGTGHLWCGLSAEGRRLRRERRIRLCPRADPAACRRAWRVWVDAALADRASARAGATVNANAAAICAERRADLA